MSTKDDLKSINVKNSPVPTGGRNLTGNPRIVRDGAVDLYNLIEKWNSLSIEGNSIINAIMNLKTKVWDEKGETEIFPAGIQDLCDQLEKTVQQLEGIADRVAKIADQYKAMARLEDFQKEMRNHGTPVRTAAQPQLFLTWPTSRYGEVAAEISRAYLREVEVRKCVLENVAHCKDRDSLFLHSVAWAHQVHVTSHVKLLLEALLAETGHR